MIVSQQRKSEQEIRDEVIQVCHWMYEREFIVATDGNVSVRLDGERILTTPSGFPKGLLRPEQLLIVDMQGKKLPGYANANPVTRDLVPSSELLMHLAAYRLRPDVKAAVHAHPPLSTAFTVAGVSLAQCVLPEVVATIVTIPTAAYAMTGTDEVPRSIERHVIDHDVLMLERHGSLTVGVDVFDAYMKLEKLEHTAKVTLTARMLGRVQELPPHEVRRLLDLRQRKGLDGGRHLYTPTPVECGGCDACPVGQEQKNGHGARGNESGGWW